MRGFKKAIKYVAAIATAGAMVGAGILAGLAYDLSTLPAPFVNDKGQFDAYIVVGENAKTIDVVGAVTVGAAFAQKAVSQVPVQGATGFVGVTGGKALYTMDDKIYYNDPINSAIQTLTNKDLSILSKGSVEGSSTTYNYNQYIELGNKVINFGNPSTDDNIDAKYYINMGTDPDNPLYTLEVSFVKTLNINDTKGKSITLFGKSFTIAPTTFDSDHSNTLVLYENSNSVLVNAGQSTTAKVGNQTYNITVTGIGSDNTGMYAGITINGEYKKMYEGESYNIAGTKVYVKSLTAYTAPQGQGSAELLLGANEWDLTNGSAVKIGDNTIDGTKVIMQYDSGAKTINDIKIEVAAPEDSAKYLFDGNSFVDPMFGFKLSFLGTDPSLNDMEKIEFTSSGNQTYMKFIPYGLSDAKTIKVFYNNGTNTFFGEKDHYIYTEYDFDTGKYAGVNDYIYTKAGSFTHLWKVDSVSYSDKKARLTDVLTGDEIDIDKGTTSGTIIVDGKELKFTITSNNKLSLVSDDKVYEPFPVFKTSDGAYLALFYENMTGVNVIATGDQYYLGADGVDHPFGSRSTNDISYSYNATTGIFNVTSTKDSFVQLMTEKAKDNNNYYWIVNAAPNGDHYTWKGTATIPKTDASDNKLYVAVDKYGVYEVYDKSSDDYKVTIYYPDYQTYMVLGLGSNPTMTAGGSAVSEKVNPIDVSSFATLDNIGTPDKPVILIGGPAINKLVATLANNNMTTTLSQWRSGNMTNKAIIQYIDNAFGNEPALVIAGYSGTDTLIATKVLADHILNPEDYKDKFVGNKITLDTSSGSYKDVKFE